MLIFNANCFYFSVILKVWVIVFELDTVFSVANAAVIGCGVSVSDRIISNKTSRVAFDANVMEFLRVFKLTAGRLKILNIIF